MRNPVGEPGEKPEDWTPDLIAGLAVVVAGIVEWRQFHPYVMPYSSMAPPVLGMALAVVLTRRRPAWALGVLCVLGAIQLYRGSQLMLIQLAIMYVFFGVARWGRALTVGLSLLLVPVALAAGAIYQEMVGSWAFYQWASSFPGVFDRWGGFGSWQLVGLSLVALILGMPWLLGLAVRFGARASASDASRRLAEADAAQAQQVSEQARYASEQARQASEQAQRESERAHRESEQAQQIAVLREQQARLATDVHDVVGHSLAVILAQAESGQFLDDPERLKQTMATIATSARSSLRDTRQVLGDARAAESPGSFEELIAGVRSGGHEVLVSEQGQPRPLPPELEVVAHRVAQEMLTNAIRHGRRDRPVHVERSWPEGQWGQDLRIEVRNTVGLAATRLIEATPQTQASQTQPVIEQIPQTQVQAQQTQVQTQQIPDQTQPTPQQAQEAQQSSAPNQQPSEPGQPQGPGQGLEGMRRRLESVGGKLSVRQPEDSFVVTAWVPVSGR